MHTFLQQFQYYNSTLHALKFDVDVFNAMLHQYDANKDLAPVIDHLNKWKDLGNVEISNCLEVLKHTVSMNTGYENVVIDALKNVIENFENKETLHNFYDVLFNYEHDIKYIARSYDELKKEGRLNSSLSFIFCKAFEKAGNVKRWIDAYHNALLRSIGSYDTYKQFKKILRIQDPKLWLFIISEVGKERRLLQKFFDIDKESTTELIDTLKGVNSSDVYEALVGLFFEAIAAAFDYNNYHEYYGRDIIKSDLLPPLFTLLHENIDDLMERFIDYLHSEDLLKYRRQLIDLVAKVVDKNDVITLIEHLDSPKFTEDDKNSHKFRLINLYKTIKRASTDNESILGEFEKKLGKEISSYEKAQEDTTKKMDRQTKSQNRKRRLKVEAQKALTRNKDYINERVIHQFIHSRFTLSEKDDIEFVKQEVKKFFSDKKYYLPEKATLQITKVEESSTSYTTASYIANSTFSKCLELAKTLSVPIKRYKKKLVHFMPFAYGKDLENIFAIVDSLTEKDVDYLLSVYSTERDKIDDLRRFHPNNILEIYEKYSSDFAEKHESLIEILKGGVEDVRIGIYYRKEFLTSLGSLASQYPDKVGNDYFKAIFNKYNQSFNYVADVLANANEQKVEKEAFGLAFIANKILVKVYHSEEALNWVLEQLKQGASSYTALKPNEDGMTLFHGVTKLEEELETDRGGRSDRMIDLLRYFPFSASDKILELLQQSFEIYAKGSEFIAYARYLQAGIYIFYSEHLNEPSLIDILDEIEVISLTQMNEKVSYDFRYDTLPNLYEKYLANNSLDAPEYRFMVRLLRSKNAQLNQLQKEKIESEITDNGTEDELSRREKYFGKNKILLVEGYTDKLHIELAYRMLFGEQIDFFVFACGGVSGINSCLFEIKSKMSLKEDDLVVSIYDFDAAGYGGFFDSSLLSNNEWMVSKDNVTYKNKCYSVKSQTNNFYKVLLPCPDILQRQVYRLSVGQTSTAITTSTDSIDGTHGKDSRLGIEHLYYYAGCENYFINSQKKPFFETKIGVGGGEIVDFHGDKYVFYRLIQDGQQNGKLNKEVFNNFIPLFNFLRSIS